MDRDNDLGTKVGIQSPVIGRADVLEAAMTLGLADPEEADTNSFLAGLKVLDDYVKNGVDAEIAIICGDADVGIRSDSMKLFASIILLIFSLSMCSPVFLCFCSNILLEASKYCIFYTISPQPYRIRQIVSLFVL